MHFYDNTHTQALLSKPGKYIKYDYTRKGKTDVYLFPNYLTPPFFTNTSTVFIDMNILYVYYTFLGL